MSNESLGIILGLVMIITIPSISVGLGLWSGNHRCKVQAEKITVVSDYDYGFFTGCLWYIDDKWEPADRYRKVE